MSVGPLPGSGHPGGRPVRALYGGIGLLVVCRVGGAFAALLVNVLLARALGIEQMGIALMAIALATLGALAASGGLEAGAVRYLASYRATGRDPAARGYLRFTARGVWAVGAVVGLAALGAIATMPGTPAAFALAVPGAVLLAATRVSASHCHGLGHPVASNAPLQLFRPVLMMAGIAALATGVLPMAGPLDATAVMVVFVISAGATLALQATLAARARRPLGPGPSDAAARGEWVRTGLQLGLAAFFIEFGKDLAVLLAGTALPPEDVARLGVAIRIVGLLKFGIVAVNQSFMPHLSAAMARGDEGAIARNIALSNHLKLWPVLAAIAVVLTFREQVLGVFGRDFVAAAPALAILLVEPFAAALLGPGSSVLTFSRMKGWILPITVSAAAVLAAGVVLGGRFWGLEGAAAGVAAAWIFWSGGLAFVARRGLGRDVTVVGSVDWLLRNERGTT